MSRKLRIQEEAAEIAAPIIEEMGLQVVDVEYTGRGREQVLRLYLDRPGGVTVDELQQASQAVEKALEIAELLTGHYRLEVSSPGIDRPLRRPEDFAKHVGAKLKIKLFSPLPDGSRSLSGTVVSSDATVVVLRLGEGSSLTLPLSGIASARPEIDWDELLKKPSGRSRNKSHARRSP